MRPGCAVVGKLHASLVRACRCAVPDLVGSRVQDTVPVPGSLSIASRPIPPSVCPAPAQVRARRGAATCRRRRGEQAHAILSQPRRRRRTADEGIHGVDAGCRPDETEVTAAGAAAAGAAAAGAAAAGAAASGAALQAPPLQVRAPLRAIRG